MLNLSNPTGIPPELQRRGLDTLRQVNQRRYAEVHDPEIAARIASYELAYRMQSAAPELIDLSQETAATLEAYGVDRSEPAGAREAAASRATPIRVLRVIAYWRGGWWNAACDSSI